MGTGVGIGVGPGSSPPRHSRHHRAAWHSWDVRDRSGRFKFWVGELGRVDSGAKSTSTEDSARLDHDVCYRRDGGECIAGRSILSPHYMGVMGLSRASTGLRFPEIYTRPTEYVDLTEYRNVYATHTHTEREAGRGGSLTGIRNRKGWRTPQDNPSLRSARAG